jgi:hypothetical protein
MRQQMESAGDASAFSSKFSGKIGLGFFSGDRVIRQTFLIQINGMIPYHDATMRQGSGNRLQKIF